MGTNPVQRAETAETVSANVKRLRMQKNLGLRALSQKLGEVGRPLGHSAVDQIEKGTRRVDVDDLTALAAALGVSPATLLMPDWENRAEKDRVEITGFSDEGKNKLTFGKLWKWLTADDALPQTSVQRSVVAIMTRTMFVGASCPPWIQEQKRVEDAERLTALLLEERGRDHGDD